MTGKIPKWHRWLRDRGITIKALFIAVVVAVLLPFHVSEETLQTHAIKVVILVPFLCAVCYFVVGSVAFKTLLISSLSGTMLYLAVAIPLAFASVHLTPHMNLHTRESRWLYTALYPVRMLGIFAAGMTLYGILSPTNFLKFGRLGVWMTVVHRSFEYADQQLSSTIEALRLQGQWPEKKERFLGWRALKMLIASCTKLVVVCFRNTILWSPWAFLSFSALKKQVWRKSK